LKKLFLILWKLILFIFLTIAEKTKWQNRFKPLLTFLIVYGVSTFLLVPVIAPIFGREKVKHTEIIKPTNFLTIILNRNYVRPTLNTLLKNTAEELKGTGITINYLDANFPFIDKFPLLPHLSHNDGKKIDLSLIYETRDGNISNKQKSNSGYGFFEDPRPNEPDQIKKCLDSGYFQYDFPKYLTLGTTNKDLQFSEKGTKGLILAILKRKDLGKIFIEPHLKARLKLADNKVRYHGCRAVRHDDHIHLQLK